MGHIGSPRHGRRGLAIAALTIAALLSGCAGPFSFAPPKPPSEEIMGDQRVVGGIRVARHYVQEYDRMASELADAPQLFELPLLAAGALAAGGLAFGAHPDLALGSALGAGTIVTGNQYYAPRGRAAVYRQGAEAMACVRDSAKTVLFLDSDPTGSTRAAGTEGAAPEVRRADRFRDAAKTLSETARTVSAAAGDVARDAVAAAQRRDPGTPEDLLAKTRRAAALNALTVSSERAVRLADAVAARAASARDDIVDATVRVRNATQQKAESSSTVPSFGSVGTALKSNMEESLKLAAELETALDAYRTAQAEVKATSSAEDKAIVAAASDSAERVFKEGDPVVKLRAALAECVALAPK